MARVIVLLSTILWGTAFAGIAAAQSNPQGLEECGTRAPLRYAVVFDASSSVRSKPELQAQYASLLRAFAAVLCRADSLTVHAFPRTRTEELPVLDTITSQSRSPEALSRLAQQVISTHTGHTDLTLTLAGIQRDLLKPHSVDAVFLVTDGSFFPSNPLPSDRTVPGLVTRLNGLAEFVANTIRLDSVQLYVIGVNAVNAPAIDDDLHADHLPATPDQRQWHWAGHSLDLKDDKGDDLLHTVFGTRYVAADSLSLWNLLIVQPGALWTRKLDYVTGWEFPLEKYRIFSIEHIVFIPDATLSGAVSCPAVADPGKQVSAIHYGTGEMVFCSLAHPTRAELERLRKEVHRHFAFLQQQSLRPAQTLANLAGLHQVALQDGRGGCKPDLVPIYFNRGRPWPLPTASNPAVGTLRFSPIDSIQWGGPVSLVQLPGSNCLVPSFASHGWSMPGGEYLMQVEHGDTSVLLASFRQASDSVLAAFIRPGGLPFPSDQIALVRVCVRRSSPLASSARLYVMVGEKRLPLTPERGRDRCGKAVSGAVVGFSGLITIESPNISTARIFEEPASGGPSSSFEGVWTPVTLQSDGRLFLSWVDLLAVFIGGILLQFLYLAWIKDRRLRLDRLLWVSAWTGAIISGIVCAVTAEFIVLVQETDVATDQVPVIFALSVLAHMAKLVAAALVSEHVEEFILND
jgi:hypothetical protein